jgi:hypothetical protein
MRGELVLELTPEHMIAWRSLTYPEPLTLGIFVFGVIDILFASNDDLYCVVKAFLYVMHCMLYTFYLCLSWQRTWYLISLTIGVRKLDGTRKRIQGYVQELLSFCDNDVFPAFSCWEAHTSCMYMSGCSLR